MLCSTLMKKGVESKRFLSDIRQLSDWYSSSLGQMLAYEEQQELDRILPDLFGYHILQMGTVEPSLLNASRILHKVVLGYEQPGHRQKDLVGEQEHLPILPDCIDTVLLHHSLDFANDPRQVLRETERVLVPEGHVIILGFNPRSLWGLRRLLSVGRKSAPWNGRLLTVNRVKDWLALLGFETMATHYRFFRPPFGRSAMSGHMKFMERWGAKLWPILGGVYILVGRKKVSTLTPIKPRWRPNKSVVAGLGDAASRSCKRNGTS